MALICWLVLTDVVSGPGTCLCFPGPRLGWPGNANVHKGLLAKNQSCVLPDAVHPSQGPGMWRPPWPLMKVCESDHSLAIATFLKAADDSNGSGSARQHRARADAK